MDRWTKWWAGVVALVLLLGVAGCGDGKKGEPKVDSNAPKLEPKTPGVGGTPGPKGQPGGPAGPKGGAE